MQANDNKLEWYTVSEVASLLKVSPTNVYNIVQAGQLVGHRIGCGRGCIRIAKTELDLYLERAKHQSRGSTPQRGRQLDIPTLDARGFKYIDVNQVLASKKRPNSR